MGPFHYLTLKTQQIRKQQNQQEQQGSTSHPAPPQPHHQNRNPYIRLLRHAGDQRSYSYLGDHTRGFYLENFSSCKYDGVEVYPLEVDK